MAKYLITGGAGFIGGNFCLYMANKYPSDFFVCLDKLTYASNIHILDKIIGKSNFKFIKADISNKKIIDEIFKKEHFDYVINFAAESHVDRSIKYPDIFIKSNVVGTQVLLHASLKYHVKHFHQVSTDEVYGPVRKNEDYIFDETSKLNPTSIYASSKASADLIALSYFKTYGLNVTISRGSNTYGPYQYKEKLIPYVISCISNNKKIHIYGDGTNIRNWIYISDHYKGIELIFKYGKPGNIYNICGNDNLSNIDMIRTLLKLFNKSEDLIEFVEDRKGHDFKYSMSNKKIMTQLKWKPEYEFKQGIKLLLDWYKCN